MLLFSVFCYDRLKLSSDVIFIFFGKNFRTDNAVKNRFTTLCKKRAKHEALAKENSNSFINLNNKRVIFPDGIKVDNIAEAAGPIKKLR